MKLKFKPIINSKSLVTDSIYNLVSSLNEENQNAFQVAKINPEYAEGNALCNKYDINPKIAFKCLIVEGKRGQNQKYAALLVPVGYKYNMGSIMRKKLDAKSVSVAPLEFTLEKTKMEYGSITPLGLPEDWKIYADTDILNHNEIILGGGLIKSKIKVNVKTFIQALAIETIENLKK